MRPKKVAISKIPHFGPANRLDATPLPPRRPRARSSRGRAGPSPRRCRAAAPDAAARVLSIGHSAWLEGSIAHFGLTRKVDCGFGRRALAEPGPRPAKAGGLQRARRE